MDLTHRFSVPAGIDETWNAINDLDALAPCFPGATVSSFDGNAFSGSVKVKLGPIALVYNGSGRYIDRDARARRVVIEARGDDRRGNGEAVATLTARLTENGDETAIEVLTDLDLTGRPAQFGAGVISDVSDRLFEQFFSCLAPRFSEGLGTVVSTEDASGSDEPDWDREVEQTIELGAVPEELDGPSELPPDEPAPVVSEAPAASRSSGTGPAAWTPPRRTAPASSPPTYTPPSNTSQTDFNVVATVGPVLLKRYWPVLAVLTVLVFVLSKVLGRRR